MMWALLVQRNGTKTYDVHISVERVQMILAAWSKQPVPLMFMIAECPCDGCKATRREEVRR